MTNKTGFAGQKLSMSRFGQQYEFVPFDEDGREMGRVILVKPSDGAARSHAGRVAKTTGGPCDLARAGGADWSERYLTTAIPSEFHKAGYCLERIT